MQRQVQVPLNVIWLKDVTRCFPNENGSNHRHITRRNSHMWWYLHISKTQEQHDKHLLQLLKTSKKWISFQQQKKCHNGKPQITFYGTIFSVQGKKPDPIKIQALQDLPTPQNQKQLQSFLGLVNYLQLFLPDIAAKTTFLSEQVSQWNWTPSTDSTYQQLKQWICNILLKTTKWCSRVKIDRHYRHLLITIP